MPNLTRRQWFAVGRYFEARADALARGRYFAKHPVPATALLRWFYRAADTVPSVEFHTTLALLAYLYAVEVPR